MAENPRAFVCGHPIAHSLSPEIHGYWLRQHGLAGTYEAVDVTPENFTSFLRGFHESGLSGGNITIPHKVMAFLTCDELDTAARQIGAVNTVWFENGKLLGSNTDAYGFLAHLGEQVPDWKSSAPAIVLGAGGAARAIVFALKQLGVPKIHIVNRTGSRAIDLAAEFGEPAEGHGWAEIQELFENCGLLVNTTSLGMKGQPPLDVPVGRLPKDAVVYDIVYMPLETKLLEASSDHGLRTVDGLGMLLHQAVPGFQKWFGKRPEVDDDIRDHVLGILKGRS